MGMINEFFIVSDSLIEKRINNDFDINEYIQNEILYFHFYKELPFWRNGVSFQTNKGWNATQAILDCLDESDSNILRKVSFDEDNYLGSDLYYKKSPDVKRIWNSLKKITVSDIEAFVEDSVKTRRVKLMKGYNMNWIENKEAMVSNFMIILNAYYTAQERSLGLFNEFG